MFLKLTGQVDLVARNCVKPSCQSLWRHPLRRPVKVHCVIVVLAGCVICRDVSTRSLVLLGWRWLPLWQSYWLQPGKGSKDRGGGGATWMEGGLVLEQLCETERPAILPLFSFPQTSSGTWQAQEMRQTRKERQYKTTESWLCRVSIERTNYRRAMQVSEIVVQIYTDYVHPVPVTHLSGFCKILHLPNLKCGMLQKFGPNHTLLATYLLKSISIICREAPAKW